MTLTTLALETGISIALVFMLFNFCMAIMNSSIEMTNKIIEDMEKQDFKAINKDLEEMDNYIRGLGDVSANYLENFNFKKDNLTEENIKKLKEAIGEYEKTKDIEKLEKILEEIKKEGRK
jgi:cob(I)alamin adenosyltransferase